jgi:probable F420-dependent oxidoreductase
VSGPTPYPLGRLGLRVRPLEARPFAEVAERVAEIEELGWPTLWITETVGREAFTFAALLLGATRRLTVATGIASIWGRDALTASGAQRTIAEAYGDRFVLGLGVSHAVVVAGVRGQQYRAPYTAMRSFLDGMDAAPFRSAPPGVPARRVLAALGPRMLELSATRADGAHPYLTTPQHTADARALLGPAAVLAPEQMVVLSTDADLARARARATLERYLGLPNYRSSLLRQGFTEGDVAGGGSERLVDALVATGDEETVRARVQEHLDAGASHVVVQPLPTADGGFDVGEIRRLSTALPGPA